MPDKSLTSRFLNAFGLERKSIEDRPSFGQASYNWSQPSALTYGYAFKSNYSQRAELGDLGDSSLVMAVCNDTGIALAEAEPSVSRPDGKGQMQPEPGHALSELILNPNPYHIWEDYCMAGAFSLWVDGNWYFQIVRDPSGQAIELWYLPHFMVEPRWPGDGKTPAVPVDDKTDRFLSHYQYSIPGKTPSLIPASDIVHLKRGVNLANPRKGIGVFEPLITEIYGDQKAAQFSATILRNMGIVVPLLAPKDPTVTITPERAADLKQQWIQGTTGDNSGTPLINTIALDATKFAFSPQELDLKELRMIPESRVAAVTRYPAAYLQFLVGLQNGTSYASYKEAREQAYESVIAPIQNGIARRISQRLLPEFEKTKGAKFFFDTSNVRVLQEDQDSLMKRAATGYLADILMRSDARRMLKLETTPEDDSYRTAAMPPEASNEPPKGFDSVAEIDQYLQGLEVQMKEFVTIDRV
jgi:phage portal protein BeeE